MVNQIKLKISLIQKMNLDSTFYDRQILLLKIDPKLKMSTLFMIGIFEKLDNLNKLNSVRYKTNGNKK